ncbi:MAG: NAD(P)-binding oxidoreductase [Pseudomonadota bacterium]
MAKRVVVFGATSGIGRLAVDEALAAGYAVRAFARTADTLAPQEGLETCRGDALNPDDVTRALEGVDAVIYALGIKERLSMLWEEETLFSESTRILLPAMTAAGVKRLIAVTGFGAGRSRQSMSFLEKTGHGLVLGKPYADKDRQETLIVESDLDWTIARPVILTKGAKSGRIRVLREPAGWRNGLVSRADVAAYLVAAVEATEDLRRDVVLAR